MTVSRKPGYQTLLCLRLASISHPKSVLSCATTGAVGCIIWELLASEPPFQASDDDILFYKILDTTPDLPSHISNDAQGLIRQLMDKDPEGRLTSEAAMNHVWLTRHRVA